MRSKAAAGLIAGSAAGAVMALGMMAYMALTDRSVCTNPNLIAVMWMGPEAAEAGLSTATLVGFATYMATSALMGLIALPFIYGLPLWRTMLAALSYALASYPVAFATIMTWLNPLMVERTGLVPMAAAHMLYGLVLGSVYLWLHPVPARKKSAAHDPR